MTEWITASASAILVMVTIVYVVLTGKLAKEARRSSEAAQRSAENSRLAAEASERAATVAEAALQVSFEAEMELLTARRFINITVAGANVYLHRADFDKGLGRVTSEGRTEVTDDRIELRTVEGYPDFPRFLHAGRPVSLTFSDPAPVMTTDQCVFGMLTITYSLSPASPTRDTFTWFTSNHDISARLMAEQAAKSNPDHFSPREGTSIPDSGAS